MAQTQLERLTVAVPPEDAEWFRRWCAANGLANVNQGLLALLETAKKGIIGNPTE